MPPNDQQDPFSSTGPWGTGARTTSTGKNIGYGEVKAPTGYWTAAEGAGRHGVDQANQYLQEARSGDASVAQQQLQRGLGQAQRQAAQQAVGRGSNPLAQRAAVYAGGQMAGQANTEASMLRAQEMAQAYMMQQQAIANAQQGYLGLGGQQLQQQIAQQQAELGAAAEKRARDAEEMQKAMQIYGAISSSAGAAMGAAASDERLKQNVQPVGDVEDDDDRAMVAFLSGEGPEPEPPPATLAAQALSNPSQTGPGANMLAGERVSPVASAAAAGMRTAQPAAKIDPNAGLAAVNQQAAQSTPLTGGAGQRYTPMMPGKEAGSYMATNHASSFMGGGSSDAPTNTGGGFGAPASSAGSGGGGGGGMNMSSMMGMMGGGGGGGGMGGGGGGMSFSGVENKTGVQPVGRNAVATQSGYGVMMPRSNLPAGTMQGNGTFRASAANAQGMYADRPTQHAGGFRTVISDRRAKEEAFVEGAAAGAAAASQPARHGRPLVEQALDWFGENVYDPVVTTASGGTAKTWRGSAAKASMGTRPVSRGVAAAAPTSRVYVRQRAVPARQPVVMTRPGANEVITVDPSKGQAVVGLFDDGSRIEHHRFEPDTITPSDERLKREVAAAEQRGALGGVDAATLSRALDAVGAQTSRDLRAGGPVRIGGAARPDVGAPAGAERRFSGSLDSDAQALIDQLTAEGARTDAALGAGGPVRVEGRSADPRAAAIGQQLDEEGAKTLAQLRGIPVEQARDRERIRRQAADIASEYEREDDKTLSTLKGYTFRYKPEAQDALGLDGRPRYGIMAQDVESTPLGATMVVDTPMGKAIDGQAATGAQLALTGRLAERLEDVEARQRVQDQMIARAQARARGKRAAASP